MSDLLEAGLDRCRAAGLAVTRPEDGGKPPGIARATDGRLDSASDVARLAADDRPVAVEPIREADPTTVLSRLWNDRNHDRAALFVAPDATTAEAVRELLREPVGVRSADDTRRVFYNGPDRVPIAEGGYAAVPAGSTLEWRELTGSFPEPAGIRSTAGSDVPGSSADTGESNDDSTVGESSGDPWLLLFADDEPVARLDGLDGLDCPPRDRFPYGYHRDVDKQIRVVDFAGRPVDRYTGIGAMRDGGFQPVPAPLVPDHMFDDPIAGHWLVVAE